MRHMLIGLCDFYMRLYVMHMLMTYAECVWFHPKELTDLQTMQNPDYWTKVHAAVLEGLRVVLWAPGPEGV